ncbi:MAG: TatD family hydrolase [bacterium]|nr:TatD family hydrolase [bacterium]
MDYYRTEDSRLLRQLADSDGQAGQKKKEKQRRVFERHIELSHEVGKPLMIHCREAYGHLVEILNSKSEILNDPPGIVHFFAGTKEDAKKLLDLGFSFTFGGVITFARDYDEIIRFIPMDRILSETDAPYVTPAPYRGKRNEPAYVIEVVKKLAEIRGISVEQMREQIWENAKRVFRI